MHSFVHRRAFAPLLAGSLLVSLLAAPAPAARIGTLFNTGVGNDDAVLADNAIDPHYTAVTPPAPYDVVGTPAGNTSGASTFTGPGVVASSSGGFPIPPWVGDTASSAWITPAPDTAGPGGNYAWQTTFDLSGYVVSSAAISGRWSSDNTGLDILVNGVSTGQTNPAQFGDYSPFAIPADLLQPATNVLTFVVNNGAGEATEAGPTGLRVEFDQRDAELIPEPSAFGLAAAAALLALRRRRRAE